MQYLFLIFLFLGTVSPAHAGPSSSSCNNSTQEGAFLFDKSANDFFFCRNHHKGWESLNQIVFILNGLLPLAGDSETSTDPTDDNTTDTLLSE